MDKLHCIDPVLALNRRAREESWPVRCEEGLEFDHSELNALRDIWLARAERRAVPARSDFDARMLKPYLRHVSILERVRTDGATSRYRKRLSATSTTEMLGETVGMFLDEYRQPCAVGAWTCIMDTILDRSIALRTISRMSHPRSFDLIAECFVAPLADSRGEATLILACSYIEPQLGKLAV
jgi:hypothetical protein